MDYKEENDKESEEERDKTDAIKAMKLTRNSRLAAREEAAFVCANLFFLFSRNIKGAIGDKERKEWSRGRVKEMRKLRPKAPCSRNKAGREGTVSQLANQLRP